MSEIIDTNVVEIQFDNEQFIENVSQTVEVVNNLKETLQFDTNSFENLSKAANNIDLSGIASSLENISDRFSTFGIVGMTAIQRITNEVMTLGGKLMAMAAKPWQQIIVGGTNRAANIAKARFQLEGIFGKSEEGARKLAMAMDADAAAIEEMTGYTEEMVVAMDAANYAVADTAYGLDSAAKAASVLATSGVDVTHFMENLADSSGKMRTEMQVALRSISGVAAMANATYDDIANIFERISGNSRVFSIDLRSLSAQGLNAAATLRDYLNETREDAKLTEQDIREMVKKGEIDFMTFALAMDSAYGDHAKDANNTFNGALSNMKFGLSKIGADFIGPLRNKLIPIFNDLRLSINNVRKALNFKMKFPGLEEELSIVEAFTRIVTHLSERLHDLFTVWIGGQDVAEKAISGMSDATGVSFTQMKNLFKEVKDGAKTVDSLIDDLSKVSVESSTAVDKVVSQLAETLEKTDSEIIEMCKNGEISFEQFSNAASAAFGNNVWDKRISKTAQLLLNLALTAKNLGNGIASFVGPVIEGFFAAIADGNKGIISITDSMAQFTEKLKLSYNAQRSLAVISYKVFMILKHFVNLSFRIIRAIWKVLEPFAPLIDELLKFVEILATALEEIVDVAINSDLLNSTLELLTATFRVFGGILIGILRIILSLAEPAMRAISAVFSLLAKVILSFNFSFLSKIAEGFEKLFTGIFKNVILNGFVLAVTVFLGVIKSLADGIEEAFNRLHSIIASIIYVLGLGIKAIVGFFEYLGQKLVSTIKNIITFITNNFLKIVAITQEVLLFMALYNILNFGKIVSEVIETLGFKIKTEGMLDLAKAVRTLAEAFLIMSAACIALALIPEDKLKVVLKLLYTISRMVAAMTLMIMGYRIALLQLKKAYTLATAKSLFIHQATRSLEILTRSIRRFIGALSAAVTLKAIAVTVLGFVAALWILAKAMEELGKIGNEKFEENFKRVTKIIALFTLSMLALEKYAKGAGFGMMGTAVAMLAYLVVIKEMVNIVDQYASMEYGILKWIGITVRLATVMTLLTFSMALIGDSVKGAGFGLMGSTVAMLGFLVVLRAMETVISEYAQIDFLTVASSMLKMALVMGVFVTAIGLMSNAISGESSFSAALKKGVSIKRSSKNFIGLIMTMFAMCILFNQMSKVVKQVAEGGLLAGLSTIALVMATMYGISEVMKSMKGVNGFSTLFGLALVVTAVSAALMAFTLLDTNQILAAAISLGIIFETLAHSMSSLSKLGKVKGGYVSFNPKPIVELILSIGTAMMLINYSSGGDWKTTIASAFALARVISALILSFKLLSGIKIENPAYLKQAFAWMSEIAVTIGLVVVALTVAARWLNADPTLVTAMAVSLSMIALAMAGTLRILKGVTVDPNIWKGMLSVAGSLGVLAIALARAGNIFKGGSDNILALTSGLLILTPLIFTLSMVVGILSKSLRKDEITTGIIGLGAIMLFITLFAGAMAGIAQFGDVANSVVLLEHLGLAMLKLIPAILLMTVIAGILGSVFELTGGLTAAALVLGLVGLGAVMLAIGLFVKKIAQYAQIGDVTSTVVLLSALGSAMTSLIPFIIAVELVSTLLGLALPLMLMGITGLSVLLTIISNFAFSLSIIAQIGNISNTVTLLASLTSAMVSMKGFIIQLMAVLTIVGALGAATGIGVALFNSVLNMMVAFVAALQKLSTAGNIGQAMTTMNSLIAAMASLTVVFSTIMLIGVNAIPVIAGLSLMATALGALFTVCLVIGAFSPLKNLIDTGVSVIANAVNMLAIISNAIVNIGLDSVRTFLTILELFDSVKLSIIAKIGVIVAGLVLVVSPVASLGLWSANIALGMKTAMKMMVDLHNTMILAQKLNDVKLDGIIEATDDLIRLAMLVSATAIFSSAASMIHNFGDAVRELISVAGAMMNYSGEMITGGLAEGMTDQKSRTILTAASLAQAAVIATVFQNFMGIHSHSDLGIWWGHMTAGGIGEGMTDVTAVKELVGSVTGMGDIITDNASPLFEGIGNLLGSELISGLQEKLSEFDWNQLLTIQGMAESGGKGKYKVKKQWNNWSAYHSSEKTSRDNRYSHANSTGNTLGNFRNEQEYLAYLAAQDKEVDKVDEAKNDLLDILGMTGDYSTLLDDLLQPLLGDDGLLGAIEDTEIDDLMGGLSDSSSGASKSVDKLTQSLDNLMDKYENLWEDAKENAKKDLFKGVDGQGDDFLSQVDDIMSQYENIYKTAVERTNSQDLFAEVKEDDEAFAPETLLKRLQAQVDQINELNTITASLSARITDENLREAISQMDVDQLPELRAMYRMSDSDLEAYQKAYQEKVQANQNKIQNELSASISKLTGEYTNISEFIATDASTQALVNNLQAQIDQLNIYNETVASLMSRITNMDLRQAIAEMGVDALPELQRLNAMNDTMLSNYESMYSQKIAAEAVSIKQELSAQLSALMGEPLDISEFYIAYKNGMTQFKTDVENDEATAAVGRAAGSNIVKNASSEITDSSSAKEAGKEYTTDVADGMVEKDAIARLEANAKLIVDTVINTFTGAYDSIKEIGNNIVDQICAGIDVQRRGVGFTNTINELIYGIDYALTANAYNDWIAIGKNITDGISTGIGDKEAIANLEKSVKAMAAKAINTVRTELKIASPSRVFMQIGRFMDEGLAIGLRNYSSVADEAASDMALGTLSPVQEAIQQLSGMLDGSIEVNPVITPTLDLSQVNARSAALANMFNGREIAVQARNDEQRAEMIDQLSNIVAEQNAQPRSITFNQTNNSPKALNKTEIYRQTRNGFSQLVNAIS